MSVLQLAPMRTNGLNQSSLLSDLTSTPLEFGPPLLKSALVVQRGTRQVVSRPKSPPPLHLRPKPRSALADDQANGHVNGKSSTPSKSVNGTGNGNVGPDAPEASSSKIPSAPSTPTRKGKEPAVESAEKPTPASPSGSSASVWPGKFRQLKRPGAGLHNPSMACYANATLQVLLHTPPVVVKAISHDPDSCRQGAKGYCMLCALRTLTIKHWSHKVYSPSEVHGNLSKIKKGFSKHHQEDTHEFFRFVTDALQATELVGKPKDLPEKIKQKTWVYDTWGGKVRSRVVCSRCEKPSDTFDTFLDLSLDVPRVRTPSLQTMLKAFIREDKLEGDNKYNCENCKAKANATKSFRIAKAPPVFTFHLKRFSINYQSYKPRAEKYNHLIEYPEVIDVAPFMIAEHDAGTKYRLFAVTCHRGGDLRYGHYTSYVRAPSGSWYDADDDDMTPASLRSVLDDRNAYLLSYLRVDDEEYDQIKSSSGSKPPMTAAVNGAPHGHAPSPIPTKRKSEDETRADKPFKRVQPTPAPPSPTGSPLNSPSKFTWTPKKDHSRPFSTKRGSHVEEGRRKKKHKGQERHEIKRRGAPMPFAHGRHGKGMIGRQKRK